jgi:hypothetical protein
MTAMKKRAVAALITALALVAAGCGGTNPTAPTTKPASAKSADTCGQYAAASASAAKAEVENRPNGADDMEFTDKGRTIVLLPGQHCVRESGLTASISASGEISEGTAPATTTAPATSQTTPAATTTESREAKVAKSAYQNELCRCLWQMSAAPMVRKASWMSSRRS